jgi:sarcosine oxidase subunit gamma
VSALAFHVREPRARFGLKGPRAAGWLVEHGLTLPSAANTWLVSAAAAAAAAATATVADAGAGLGADGVLVARLGSSEFFLEDAAGGTTVRGMALAAQAYLPGIYPVLREDAAFLLSGDGVHDVLSQVCNVNFADLALGSRTVVMTLMLGVAVLVIADGTAAERSHRIWCDPTFGEYLEEAVGKIVNECGGSYRGVSA